MLKKPPWMEWAIKEVGVKETPGSASTKRILEYRKIANIPIGGEDSLVPWCAIFINAAFASVGLPGTNSALARSFVKNPNFISLKKPAVGCVVVLSSNRGPGTGHVGFYESNGTTTIRLLSGNADNAVKLSSYPKSRVVGYFWPKSANAEKLLNLKVTPDEESKTPSDY